MVVLQKTSIIEMVHIIIEEKKSRYATYNFPNANDSCNQFLIDCPHHNNYMYNSIDYLWPFDLIFYFLILTTIP